MGIIVKLINVVMSYPKSIRIKLTTSHNTKTISKLRAQFADAEIIFDATDDFGIKYARCFFLL